jgi:hypothetical protein
MSLDSVRLLRPLPATQGRSDFKLPLVYTVPHSQLCHQALEVLTVGNGRDWLCVSILQRVMRMQDDGC